VFDAQHQFPEQEKVDVVLRPEDIEMKPMEAYPIQGTILTQIFKGVHYEYVIAVGKNEVIVQDTKIFEVGSTVSLFIDPSYIHIMKRELSVNQYKDIIIHEGNKLYIDQGEFTVDVSQLLEGSKVDETGTLIGPKHNRYKLNQAKVTAEIAFSDIELVGDVEEGQLQANVVQCIYKGDHYQIVVRTDDEEDFIVNSDYTYDTGTRVSLKIPGQKIKLKLRGDLSDYEI
jgi:spermidine/putrescine transport system ATP-binding protein